MHILSAIIKEMRYKMKETDDFELNDMVDNLEFYLEMYFELNGIISIKELEKIALKSGIDKKIYEDNKLKLFKKIGIEEYGDNYCILKYLLNTNYPIKELLNIKKDFSYIVLPDNELEKYFSKLLKFRTAITKELKIDNESADSVLVEIMFFPYNPELLAKQIIKKFKLHIDDEKVSKLIQELQSEIRFWCFNGRNFSELAFEEDNKNIEVIKKKYQNEINIYD
jgi:hypothetical protein